ncbi:hypothetical protein HELRODRAFT_96746 [Helobdella robusta]|uniref:BTB domain-containing protein n=1 Tax=Helobdella robusta TaxID=6412 RepID=T1G9D5_HELRO|nr:hypothetical protein HELRODRAFT_96746 [Helobdella robusta]ESO11571.1 hypothetical protein HELRODRAFT_96746 [Helobdella robusta]
MMQRMEMYLHRRQLCDVVLITTSGRRVPAHRLVLAAASDYFAAMFTSDLLEADLEEVVIKEVEPDALVACVRYIYTGQLDLREDTVESILSASCLLQLPEASIVCSRFLSKQLHPSNCIGIRQFADLQGCCRLYDEANAYVLENFMEVTKHQEFNFLAADDLVQLLCSDDIRVSSEVVVFEALVCWAKHDEVERKKDLGRLLACVRLPLLPAQYIADKVAACPLFREDLFIQDLIMESLKYHLLPERRMTMYNMRTRPRKSTVGVLYAVGGMDCGKGAVSMEKYDMRTDQWSQVACMNGRRLQFGVAVIDLVLYVVGGRDGLKTLNSVECYDCRTDTWSSVNPMATHRHGLGVGVLGGPMYAVGGHDGWSYLATVERWDVQTQQWSYVAPLSTPRSTAGVVVLGNKLYAVGGRDGSSCLRSMECYDPHTNKWSICCPMNKRRGGVGVAVCNEFLYAVGGHDAPSSNPASSRFDCVERYDPKTDTWTAVAPISSPRDAVGVCVLGDKLFAVGGYDGQRYLNDVEAFDTHLNEWSEVAPLRVGRAGACVVHLAL